MDKDLEFRIYIKIVNVFQNWLKWFYFLIQAVSLLDFHYYVVYIPRYRKVFFMQRFFPKVAKLYSSLFYACFPLSDALACFKTYVNNFLAYLSFNLCLYWPSFKSQHHHHQSLHHHPLHRNLYITILYIAISTSPSCTSQSHTIIFFITICKSSNFTLQSLHTLFFITQSLHHHLLHHSFYVRIFFTVVVLFNSSL